MDMGQFFSSSNSKPIMSAHGPTEAAHFTAKHIFTASVKRFCDILSWQTVDENILKCSSSG